MVFLGLDFIDRIIGPSVEAAREEERKRKLREQLARMRAESVVSPPANIPQQVQIHPDVKRWADVESGPIPQAASKLDIRPDVKRWVDEQGVPIHKGKKGWQAQVRKRVQPLALLSEPRNEAVSYLGNIAQDVRQHPWEASLAANPLTLTPALGYEAVRSLTPSGRERGLKLDTAVQKWLSEQPGGKALQTGYVGATDPLTYLGPGALAKAGARLGPFAGLLETPGMVSAGSVIGGATAAQTGIPGVPERYEPLVGSAVGGLVGGGLKPALRGAVKLDARVNEPVGTLGAETAGMSVEKAGIKAGDSATVGGKPVTVVQSPVSSSTQAKVKVAFEDGTETTVPAFRVKPPGTATALPAVKVPTPEAIAAGQRVTYRGEEWTVSSNQPANATKVHIRRNDPSGLGPPILNRTVPKSAITHVRDATPEEMSLTELTRGGQKIGRAHV